MAQDGNRMIRVFGMRGWGIRGTMRGRPDTYGAYQASEAVEIRQVRSSYPEGGYGGFGHEFRKSMREEYLGARRGMVTWSRRGDGADAGFYSYSLGVTMVWEEGKEVTRQYWMAC
jgi:hypothetical protein